MRCRRDRVRWGAYLVRVRYPDGGGLTSEGRAPRETVRLQAALFGQGVPVSEIAGRLWVSHNAVHVWRRRWLADGEAGLASKAPSGSAFGSPTSNWIRLRPRGRRGRSCR
ncbi:helix-turn-helix domain-containing protein [Micromonospora matsumotoense]|uniref:helix-turn-helix domain-containing protein n=1 Tax=Micromonospora matsumotoense TaxID=121616 RepID=UPI0034422A26